MLKNFFGGLGKKAINPVQEEPSSSDMADIATGRKNGFIWNGLEPVPTPPLEVVPVDEVTVFSDDVEAIKQPMGPKRLQVALDAFIEKLDERADTGKALSLKEFRDISIFFSEHEAWFDDFYLNKDSALKSDDRVLIKESLTKCTDAADVITALVPEDQTSEFMALSDDSNLHRLMTQILENSRVSAEAEITNG